MKEHKYNALIEQAEKMADAENGEGVLILAQEGDSVAFLSVGDKTTTVGMLLTAMKNAQGFADMVIAAAGDMVKTRMVESLQGKEAIKAAYNDTKIKS